MRFERVRRRYAPCTRGGEFGAAATTSLLCQRNAAMSSLQRSMKSLSDDTDPGVFGETLSCAHPGVKLAQLQVQT